MKHKKHLTILSGAGSPHGQQYQPVYELIKNEGERRGVSVHLIDYVGFGHYPDFGLGLSLPSAVSKALADIKCQPARPESTLLCRSFGCDVGAHLIAHHREEMRNFSRIILWGPSAYHTYWDLVARHSSSLSEINQKVKSKGVQLSADFWPTMIPIEMTAKTMREISVEIGYGTKDKYCDAPFANYLGKILEGNTSCPVRVAEILNAEHEIRPETDERIKSEYFRLIFNSRS